MEKKCVSDYYNLKYKQGELPFVDVDIYGDTELFLDPRAIRYLDSPWGDKCVSLLQNFFQTVLKAIKESNNDRARSLLNGLHEPNETHLGYSLDKASGRGAGPELAQDIWESLSKSEAAKSGLLVDLEDAVLMVDGIDVDIISDITTNVIRGPLIEFTQQACHEFKIPLETGVESGPIWNPSNQEWQNSLTNLPMTENGRLLLVPKIIVRKYITYDRNEYFRYYILTHLQDVHLKANTELVQLLKDGRKRVTKKSLIKKYGHKKSAILRITQQYPEILEKYRKDKSKQLEPPLNHEDFEAIVHIDEPRWNKLLGEVINTKPGPKNANKYHEAIERLLTPLFYPSLIDPVKEFTIHDGRKRIDIKYTNTGEFGFFKWLSMHYPAAHIFIECKNYTGDPANPELDQLSGRFSPSRGKVGLLLCRKFENKKLFIQRCKDTANDQRGYIIPLDDHDLTALVNFKRDHTEVEFEKLLKEKFDSLIM